ncbi:MAG: hypothetical protein C4341_03715 [Armatimonadota bacterium]
MNREPRFHCGLPDGLPQEGEWYATEFANDELGLTVRGKFRLSPFDKLNEEQTAFLTTFLRCRGVITAVERELGISYPTARARLDSLLQALGLTPTADAPVQKVKMTDRHKEILQKLETGELSPEEAKQALKEASGR